VRGLVAPILLLAALSPTLAAPADAQRRASKDEESARVVPRQPPAAATVSVRSESGMLQMLLLDSTFVMQLTDRGLAEALEGTRRAAEPESFAARLLGGMLREGLRTLLDHGIEYRLADVRKLEYSEGQIVLQSCTGGPSKMEVEINGERERFPRAEGSTFVRQVNRARRAFPPCAAPAEVSEIRR
jgi:hypothetical protein